MVVIGLRLNPAEQTHEDMRLFEDMTSIGKHSVSNVALRIHDVDDVTQGLRLAQFMRDEMAGFKELHSYVMTKRDLSLVYAEAGTAAEDGNVLVTQTEYPWAFDPPVPPELQSRANRDVIKAMGHGWMPECWAKIDINVVRAVLYVASEPPEYAGKHEFDTELAFWETHGYTVKSVSLGEEELNTELATWFAEHKSLDGFTASTGEQPVFVPVHNECGN